jgi:hypothetical protein
VLRSALLFLLLCSLAAGATELRIATLNCFLLFEPRHEQSEALGAETRLTPSQYRAKVRNLASLVDGFDVVGLEETGGSAEIAALARRAGMSWAFVEGRDTATGEEVGLLYRLPGWQVSPAHRVPELDRTLSKHLEVIATSGRTRSHLLVVHLLRPTGIQGPRHQLQLAAVGRWMRHTLEEDRGATVVVIGDTNSTLRPHGISLFGAGSDAGERANWPATHLSNHPFDRLVVDGAGSWSDVVIRRPPYGVRPTAAVKKVWTDHYLLGARLHLP